MKHDRALGQPCLTQRVQAGADQRRVQPGVAAKHRDDGRRDRRLDGFNAESRARCFKRRANAVAHGCERQAVGQVPSDGRYGGVVKHQRCRQIAANAAP